jgi:hypothetical protein
VGTTSVSLSNGSITPVAGNTRAKQAAAAENIETPIKTYDILNGLLAINVVNWGDYKPEKPAEISYTKLLDPHDLFFHSFWKGALAEEMVCYSEWGWREHKWSISSARKRYILSCGEGTRINLKDKIEKEIVKIIRSKWNNSVMTGNYKDLVKTMDAKSLLMLAALATEGIMEYWEAPNNEPEKETPVGVKKTIGPSLGEILIAHKEGRNHFNFDGVILDISIKDTENDTSPASSVSDSGSNNKNVMGTCHDYTYIFENIINWFRFDLRAQNLNNIYVIENWAPGHMWPLVVEFRGNRKIAAVELDPTMDDFRGGTGESLQTGSSWLSNSVTTNIYFNLMIGMRIALEAEPSESGERELKRLCSEFVNRVEPCQIFGRYSYFCCYLPMASKELKDWPKINVDVIPKERLAEIIYQEIKSIPVAGSGDSYFYVNDEYGAPNGH